MGIVGAPIKGPGYVNDSAFAHLRKVLSLKDTRTQAPQCLMASNSYLLFTKTADGCSTQTLLLKVLNK